ncbi:MAG: hypothetical protein BWX99_02724 [Deltaproteobacteria bacterium ADurb.Bin151]|nr:MAG: hypothetical protein BWX99_02724 [Deltaproteobacteria bacterium ADurb.Bin151]
MGGNTDARDPGQVINLVFLFGGAGQDILAAQIQKPQFGQLFALNRGGRTGKGTACAAVFGKGNDVPDGRGPQDHRHGAVHPEGKTAVRRCTEIKSPQEKSEFFPHFFFIEPQRGKYFSLDIAVVDADAAAPQFLTVHHQVVSAGMQREQLFNIFRIKINPIGRGKRMVARGYASFFPGFKQRKFRDPDRIKTVFVNQPQTICQMQAKLAKRGCNDTV